MTHILTGACLARAGLNRRAAYTTLTMAVAAEFPDIDTLWGLRGPVAGFQHHRGITHTLLGIPFEAALLVGGVYLLDRLRRRRAIPKETHAEGSAEARKRFGGAHTSAPPRWDLLYAFALLALLSHLWLDFTNNYGVRPFFPFNPHWYAASITFIFDPAMFLLLLGAVVLPSLFRLVSSEVGTRRQPFAARGWAIAALLGVGALWGWRAVEHSRAEQMALAQTYAASASPTPALLSQAENDTGPLPAAPPPRILQAQRVNISPDPLNPFRWYSVIDFGPLYQLGTVDLQAGTLVPQQATEQKPRPTLSLTAAEGSSLGRAYLDWSPMPFLEVLPSAPDLERPEDSLADGVTAVTFRDPRFLGDMRWLRSSGRAPLTGVVEVDAHGQVLRETFDGKVQR